jgi:hypothetical protein
MTETELKVVKLKGLITFSPGWRHPILHWRLRHLRRDIKAIDKRRQAGDPVVLMGDEIDRRMEEQLLYGVGGDPLSGR